MQMYYGRHPPRHLPSGRLVSGHFSFRTQSVKAFVLRTTRATVSAFWTRSVRAFILLDTASQGICTPDDMCHGICLLDEKCHGIFLTDAARVIWMQSVKAIFFQTERVKANVWTRLTMARHIGHTMVMVVASRRDCHSTVQCSKDYQTIVTQFSSIHYI